MSRAEFHSQLRCRRVHTCSFDGQLFRPRQTLQSGSGNIADSATVGRTCQEERAAASSQTEEATRRRRRDEPACTPPSPRRSSSLRCEDPEPLFFVTTQTVEVVFWLHPLLCSRLAPCIGRRQLRRRSGLRLGVAWLLALSLRHQPGARRPASGVPRSTRSGASPPVRCLGVSRVGSRDRLRSELDPRRRRNRA